MKKPNFFILGAPKCGTTSLAVWLAAHPQVYMAPKKEPHFFNTDDGDGVTRTLDSYERLFRGAHDGHKAVGEASVWYLFSEIAVPSICRYAKDPRFVVCVRNPVEMAYSLHNQQVVNMYEPVWSFEEAWGLEDKRLRGEEVTRWCAEPRHLAYASACSLGEQLERLYSRLDRARVLTVVLDDMQQDPGREYRRVLDFLGVDDDGCKEFPRYNAAKELRSSRLREAVVALGHLKRLFIRDQGLGILGAIDRLNFRERPRKALTPEFRRELQDYFAPDVEKLSRLLNRDLSHWTNG